MNTFHRWLVATALIVSGASAPSHAQTITQLAKDGDVVPGIGNITSVDDLSVNDSGTWLVEVDTDGPVNPGDGAVLSNGVVYAYETQPLAAPVGAGISSFGSIKLDDSGRATWS